MSTVWLLLVWSTAAAHLSLIVILVAGGPMCVRRPRFIRVHVLVAVAVGTVFALGADCPLTTWEKRFLERSGRSAYSGGFLEHYLLDPITGGRDMTPAMQALVVATWLAPTLVGYSIVASRRHRRRTLGLSQS